MNLYGQICLRQEEIKKKKKPSCKDREAVAHGIDLLIVNDFIFTHESKSSDEQLRKKNRRENK